ncbi:MAG: ABC transporter ATP-binding protein, partial [Gaiellaceae bacterium]
DLEDASLETDGAARQHLTGRVTLTEALGAEVMVHFKVDASAAATDDVRELQADAGTTEGMGALPQDEGGQAIMVGRFGARSGAKKGQKVRVAVDTRALHFFDRETGLGIYDGTERKDTRG